MHKTTVCTYGFKVSTCRCADPNKIIVRVTCNHRGQHFGAVGPYGDATMLQYKPKHRKEGPAQ